MKIYLLVTVFFTYCCTTQAQTSPKQDTVALSSNEKDTVYTNPEIEPAYPGGQLGWKRYLKVMLRYPDEAMEKGIQGDVTIQFIVDINGKISNLKLYKGNPMLADEGMRLIKKSGKWVPGVHGGRLVKAYKLQTISFMIE
jgi:periplasmic protein TonB